MGRCLIYGKTSNWSGPGRYLPDVWLKEVDKASVRKKMAEIGLKVAEHLGDKKALVRYAETQAGY